MSAGSASAGDSGPVFQERFDLLVLSGQANQQSVTATQMALGMVERHYGVAVTEALGASLVNHLAVTLKRLLDGDSLIQVPEVVWQELQAYPDETALAATIVAELEKSLKITLGRDELGFIAVHLCKIRNESGLDHAT
jgi:transcriptional regulatory protein LevR